MNPTTIPATSTLLKYAELQVAAEAVDPQSVPGLKEGNTHSSRFVASAAESLSDALSAKENPALKGEQGSVKVSTC
jgi:hypothetical protein